MKILGTGTVLWNLYQYIVEAKSAEGVQRAVTDEVKLDKNRLTDRGGGDWNLDGSVIYVKDRHINGHILSELRLVGGTQEADGRSITEPVRIPIGVEGEQGGCDSGEVDSRSAQGEIRINPVVTQPCAPGTG